MSEIETLAKGLTEAQKSALFHLERKPWHFPYRWLILVGYSLEEIGLSKRTWLLDKSYLTPLGIQVRDYLKGKS